MVCLWLITDSKMNKPGNVGKKILLTEGEKNLKNRWLVAFLTTLKMTLGNGEFREQV